MYVPLRFAPVRPSGDGSAAELGPAALLARTRPLVVQGNAGTGKTTWMRWTFRELARDPTVVPFYFELRAIAKGWEQRAEARRTFLALLEDELQKYNATTPAETVRALLAASCGPRPVLLVDGWDELGELGAQIRELLAGLRAAWPRVLVLVSSRPYGEHQPSHSEGFDILEIQPLDDDQIQTLVLRFHQRVYGQEEAAAERATEELLQNLAAIPEAQALARTALLLTMVLLLNRRQALPERRHMLYKICLEGMLHARPELREHDGAQRLLDEWRPEDRAERMLATAELAFRMQSAHNRYRRAPVVRAWDQALLLLPAGWSDAQRGGFLLWLINSAGVLVDRSDGAVSFAHLSFQEYLAAEYLLRTTRERTERLKAMQDHGVSWAWWETLRHWAALLGDQDPIQLRALLGGMSEPSPLWWLAGAILADGTGQLEDVERWAVGLGAAVGFASMEGLQCARAWAASRQAERRAVVERSLARRTATSHWPDVPALQGWAKGARLELVLPPHLAWLDAPLSSPVALARSRAVAGASWAVPGSIEVVLARMWPSPRARIALSLQAWISLGGDRAGLLEVARMLWPQASRPAQPALDDALPFAQKCGGLIARHIISDSLRIWQHPYQMGYINCFIIDIILRYGLLLEDVHAAKFAYIFVEDFGYDLPSHDRRHPPTEENKGLYPVPLVEQIAGNDFDLIKRAEWFANWIKTRSEVRDVADAWTESMPHRSELWHTFMKLEVASLGWRGLVRAVLASEALDTKHPAPALIKLFRDACHASLSGADMDAVSRNDALQKEVGDPLWLALARHLTHHSTLEDRELLEELAADPEQRDGLLSWALKYWVRGDIVLDDDTHVTLDEIAAEIGLPGLPYLEEAPSMDLAFDLDDLAGFGL